MREIILPAVEQLCAAFESNGYNPTPIIDLGVLVANAGGRIDERERETLLEVFQVLLDTTLTPQVVGHLVTASLEVIEAAGAGPRTRLVAEILQDCDAVEQGILVALAVAFASQGLSKTEREVIDRVAAAAGLAPERVEKLVRDLRAHVPAEGDPESARISLSRLPKADSVDSAD